MAIRYDHHVHCTCNSSTAARLPHLQYFKGIPYAGSTAPPNRFLPPTPLQPWTGTLNATEFAPGCVQTHHNPDVPAQQSEDCLNLNVYAPAGTQAGDALPVIVFIHGGAFQEGSNRGPFDMYEATYGVQQHPVVWVTINYRLGNFGWLALTDDVPGNMGILDQRAALQWVAANIAAFGGDGSKVTLQGESAGAMSIGVHMVSPGSKGLFSRAIQESNPAGFPYRSRAEQALYGAAYCKAVQCEVPAASLRGAHTAAHSQLLNAASIDSKQWLGKLSLMPQQARESIAQAALSAHNGKVGPYTAPEALAADLPVLAAAAPRAHAAAVRSARQGLQSTTCSMSCLQGLTTDAAKAGWNKADPILVILEANFGHWFSAFLAWTPTVDGTILPENEIPAAKAGTSWAYQNKVDMLISTNTNEGATFIYAAIDFALPPWSIGIVYDVLFGSKYTQNITAMPAYNPKDFEDGRQPLSHATTDHLFRCPSQALASAVATAGGQAWVARYNHVASFSYIFAKFGLPDVCVTEVCHASELPFVFHARNTTGASQNITFTPAELSMSANMVQYWVNFAITGNPNTPAANDKNARQLPVQWPSWNSQHTDLMINSTHYLPESTPQCPLWDLIGYEQSSE